MVNGKQKGSGFERECCKELSLWITDGKMEDCLWRSAMSGGRATVARRKGQMVRQSGDICAVSPEGHILTDKWFIECKNYRRLQLDQFLVKGTGDLATFWKKACEEAARDSKDPMLIAKQNSWPTLIIGRPNHLSHWAQPLIRHELFEIWLYKKVLSVKFAPDVITRYRVPIGGGVTIKP